MAIILTGFVYPFLVQLMSHQRVGQIAEVLLEGARHVVQGVLLGVETHRARVLGEEVHEFLHAAAGAADSVDAFGAQTCVVAYYK